VFGSGIGDERPARVERRRRDDAPAREVAADERGSNRSEATEERPRRRRRELRDAEPGSVRPPASERDDAPPSERRRAERATTSTPRSPGATDPRPARREPVERPLDGERAERPERPERAERAERLQRSERPETTEPRRVRRRERVEDPAQARRPARADESEARAAARPRPAAPSPAPSTAPSTAPSSAPARATWQPSEALRDASFVQLLRSSRCDERGALVVDVRIPRRDHLDPNALRVIGRLAHEGYEAYLVGGCVRDLLLGRRPKDFDVATEAHPREIKRLFRNGRIIGRRFKLVHVVYGQDVVETSTFRAPPRSVTSEDDGDPTVDDLLIVDDNEFGTAAEDARRRDFTINGLFLDPLAGEIIDYVDGLEDISARVLRTIGDPRVRIAEDPVRILRAVKFAARLGFRIDPATWSAMVEHSSGLARSAPPRVVEEILRLLQSGHAAEAFGYLDDCGALRVLLPELARWRRADREGLGLGWSVLSALDERIQRGEAPGTGFCLAALFAPAFVARTEAGDEDEDGASSDGRALSLAGDLLEPLSQVARLSRRDVGLAKRLLANQWRFVEAPSRRFRPLLFAHSPEFDDSLDLLALCARAGAADPALVDRWRARKEEARAADPGLIEVELARRKKRRRRRRRGGAGGA
jgi:poly(A) polymerase